MLFRCFWRIFFLRNEWTRLYAPVGAIHERSSLHGTSQIMPVRASHCSRVSKLSENLLSCATKKQLPLITTRSLQRLQEFTDAAKCLKDMLGRIAIGRAYKSLAALTEGSTGNDGNALIAEQPLTKLVG